MFEMLAMNLGLTEEEMRVTKEQSNFNGSNTFGTMKRRSRQG